VVFKRMLGALGVGAPSVDTVLAGSRVQPGGPLRGEVRLKGGDFDAAIEHITLGLVAKAEAEHADGEMTGLAEFARFEVSGPFTLRKGEDKVVGFEVPVPWETPISEVEGQPLTGMALGVRTELAIAKAVDKGDLDMLAVEPLPSQLEVLRAFLRAGFHFKSADVEAGHLYGVAQQLPVFQEIEFYPPGHHAGRVNEIELTFVAGPADLAIILEADKRAGRYGSGDAIGRWQVSHAEAVGMNWSAEIDRWLESLSQYGGGHHGHASHYGHDGHHGHHGHSAGMGTVVAAGAAGVVGGLVAGEIIEDIFEGEDD
jgi:sporulation-control protein